MRSSFLPHTAGLLGGFLSGDKLLYELRTSPTDVTVTEMPTLPSAVLPQLRIWRPLVQSVMSFSP